MSCYSGLLIQSATRTGPSWYSTYNDMVMNAKLQLLRPMSNDPVIPDKSQTKKNLTLV